MCSSLEKYVMRQTQCVRAVPQPSHRKKAAITTTPAANGPRFMQPLVHATTGAGSSISSTHTADTVYIHCTSGSPFGGGAVPRVSNGGGGNRPPPIPTIIQSHLTCPESPLVNEWSPANPDRHLPPARCHRGLASTGIAVPACPHVLGQVGVHAPHHPHPCHLWAPHPSTRHSINALGRRATHRNQQQQRHSLHSSPLQPRGGGSLTQCGCPNSPRSPPRSHVAKKTWIAQAQPQNKEDALMMHVRCTCTYLPTCQPDCWAYSAASPGAQLLLAPGEGGK